MKRFLTVVSVTVLCLIGLAACSSQYIISTKDGRMLTTESKPKLDDSTGMYIYDDADGRETMIKKEDVVQILER
ncbi:YgdI/YgdR family lipoprotein [Pseudaeromonas sharmana]|uniref:YgdI/YgdR family lipoprotein n=1 Tax=Pseudaeromonas sharmana TaxID=328412 RepID=A0ABV8CPD8_9GAMM